jgi:hypothetical protein
MDLQVHFFFSLNIQDVSYQFQLACDTYQIPFIRIVKWDLSQISKRNNLTNFWLWVDDKHTCDQLVDASI